MSGKPYRPVLLSPMSALKRILLQKSKIEGL
jgi:hypothetical protein